MALIRTVVRGLAFVLVFSSLPLFAIRKGDAASSQNGSFSNCTGNGGNSCLVVVSRRTATLPGKDKSGNPVTVTIALYDWGCLKCSPEFNSSVLDVVLTGTDAVGIQSLVVKGSLPSPGYVYCGEGVGVGCVINPAPDGSNIQQPTPIQGADKGANTRWDFGGVEPATIPFDSLVCESDGSSHDSICQGLSTTLGEAVLTVKNSVATNKLSTNPGSYSVTLTDGTVLGTLKVPAPPTKQVAKTNNTQDTATVISTASFSDYTDASQAYPQINTDGTEQYPGTFAPLPLTNPPPCNPAFDERTFRTAWYTYTAPSDGFIAVSTAGSRYDTLVYVFTGSASSPNVVSCNDDPVSSGGLLQAVTTFNATQGTQYEIMVGETPTSENGGIYPLSVDSILYFNFAFSTAPSATTTKITASPNPSIFGEPVTFTAMVTSKTPGVVTGTVTFSDGSTVLGTASLNGGVASLSAVPGTLSATITAAYGGSSYFNPSSGSMLQSAKQATTKLTISSSQNPSTLGQATTFTAVIAPQYSGQATGTVTFDDNGATLGVATVAGNSAILTTTGLTLGTNSITAIYGGDANFKGSTSKALSQIVKSASTATLASSPKASTSLNPVTFSVTVKSSAGTPAGTVKILTGATLATMSLKAGSDSYTTSQLSLGTDIVTADYTGNPTFGGDTSALVDQVVSP